MVVLVCLLPARQEDNLGALAAVCGEDKVLLEAALGFSEETHYPGISGEGLDEAVAAGGLKVGGVAEEPVDFEAVDCPDCVDAGPAGEIAYVVAAPDHIYCAEL